MGLLSALIGGGEKVTDVTQFVPGAGGNNPEVLFDGMEVGQDMLKNGIDSHNAADALGVGTDYFVTKAAEKIDIPFVPHFMEKWIATIAGEVAQDFVNDHGDNIIRSALSRVKDEGPAEASQHASPSSVINIAEKSRGMELTPAA